MILCQTCLGSNSKKTAEKKLRSVQEEEREKEKKNGWRYQRKEGMQKGDGKEEKEMPQVYKGLSYKWD